MHRSWRFTPSLKALAVLFGALVVAGLASSGAWAQDVTNDNPDVVKKYVLMAQGTWGAAQDAAVAQFGGTVDLKHAGSGIGLASSANREFLRQAMRSGAFAKGSEDMMVQWLDPAMKVSEESVTEDVVTPGNETFVNEQWNIVALECAGAWAAGYTGAGARVAVLDGGIHSAHVDIAPNLDVARSASFVPGFAFNQDVGTFWHGTHVAGIVAAADNGIGTVGVAPGATLIGVKVLHNGSGAFSQVISGILYASDPISAGGAGANIINMSLSATFARGGGNTGAGALVAAMNRAVNYATDHGVLVVCSAGNSALDLDHTGSVIVVPAMSGTALAVSATGPVGYAVGWPAGATDFRRPASYTNYGNSLVWLAGPGGDFALPGSAICALPRCCGGPPVATFCWVHDMVMSTVRGSGASVSTYGWSAGTSMSAPAVAGVAALVVERFPGISAGDLKTHLAQTADGVGGDDPYRPFYGHGFANARRAVTEGGPVAQMGASPARNTEPAPAAGRVELAIARNGSPTPEISFTMPSAGPARVDLYDVAGRTVAVLFDGPASAGRTTLAWNGRDQDGEWLPQGAYFARLTAGTLRTTSKLVLLGR